MVKSSVEDSKKSAWAQKYNTFDEACIEIEQKSDSEEADGPKPPQLMVSKMWKSQ